MSAVSAQPVGDLARMGRPHLSRVRKLQPARDGVPHLADDCLRPGGGEIRLLVQSSRFGDEKV